MGLFESLHIVIIALYALGTVLFLTSVLTENDRLKRIAIWLAVLGFTFNTVDLGLTLSRDPAVLGGGNFYFNIIGWCALALYFFLWWRLRLEYLAITALPFALLLFVASLALGGIRVVMPPQLTALFFGLHIGSLVLTLGALIMAFGAGVAFLYYNRKLKTKEGLSAMGHSIPSLDKFDTVNRWAVVIGFPLYTLGLFSTFSWYLIAPFKPFAWDIMKIGSLAVWFLYAFLFHQRVVLGWRGRKPAILAIWVFAGMCISLIHHTITFQGGAMNKQIILIGLNHRTAGVEVREKFALTDVENFEQGLMAHCPVQECLALSTCNRVEIMAVAKKAPVAEAMDAVVQYWAGVCNGSPEQLMDNIYQYSDLDAVKHIFTVASSLDSMVMGEPQILGQLKDAYRAAVDKGTAKTIVNRLLHKSFSVAKRIRTETAIASSAVSISFAAVELARKIFGDLKPTRAMLVGAGEMAELAATHLLRNGVKDIIIANRTLSRAKDLAGSLGGEPIQIEAMPDRLHEVDIVISSTGSPVAVIKAKDVKAVLRKRKNKPMFFIDIAVPRDIDPDVNTLDNVYLYDIDDLKEVVDENMAQRQGEATKARAVVDLETETFGNWLNSLNIQPTIVDLVGKSEDVAMRELAKTLKKIGPVDDKTRNALERLVLSIAHKSLHEPICFLKRRTQEEGSAERFIDLARRMFNLDDESVPENAHLDRKPASCAPEDIEQYIEVSKKEQ